MYVRGVFVDHRVGWPEIEELDLSERSGDGMTFYRPTVYLANGKSFWLYGFSSTDRSKAQATVLRLRTERNKHLGDSANR
jgi:hypothetical protein